MWRVSGYPQAKSLSFFCIGGKVHFHVFKIRE